MPASSAGDIFMLGQVAIILRVWMRPAQLSSVRVKVIKAELRSGANNVRVRGEVIPGMPGPGH